MDEGSGGNFEIVSPMENGVAYSVFVDGQTRNESGDYGLKVEFGVAETLSPMHATSDTTVTERGPAPLSNYGWRGLLLFYFS